MKQRQSGHTLLIIVIVVMSLAILGLLGFVFWQNFVNKPASGSNVTNYTECKAATNSKILETFPEQCVTSDGRTFVGPTTSTTEETKLASYCTKAEKLCFDYPSDWKVETVVVDTAEPGASFDKLKISSPDGAMVLQLQTGISGLGGTCPEEVQTSVYVLDSTPIAGLTGYKTDYRQDQAVVSRTVYKVEEEKFVAALYVTAAPDYAKSGTIQACGIGFSQFLDGKNSVVSSDYDSAGAMSIGYTGIDFYSGESQATIYSSVDSAKAAYKTDTYVQAAAILSSLRYE